MTMAATCLRALQCLAGDQRGAGTAWGLTSFALLVGLCGLAVDATDAFRARTMLQASADAAALAAAIDLPDRDKATAAALEYAALNMPEADHGRVLRTDDVVFGRWEAGTRYLQTGVADADAVMVTVRRSGINGNPWATNFLRILGLFDWEIVARAGAQRFIPRCLLDGLVAGGVVDLSSSNTFSGGMCVHGNAGVDMQTDNVFGPEVRVSVPELPADLKVPAADVAKNPGLEQSLVEDILAPRMTSEVPEIMEALVALDPAVTPDFVDPAEPVIVTDEKFDFTGMQPGRVYHLDCPSNKTAGIPGGASLRQVVIVAECNILASAGVRLEDVVIASSGKWDGESDGLVDSRTNLAFASGAQIGLPDDCAAGGGVQIFSTASVHFSSGATYDGVQIVAGGDIDLGSRDEGINGIIAQAGGDITMTANNAFGQCTGGTPRLFTSWYYRLVF